ncbi:hypothetical protein, conserved [Trypanosoma brucei gambiense DAL972]|uniref:Calponin-homology (CH) domain-containing protein n=1 Tax=Trypanosoma brucei gambiense (strain MHOM/CI/86/DAL972) TaxID=679716 RepID=D0A4E4_TRYB9|nr:hypothetical protein, conserved [Trypanosoma brucei gambiense DAL972]CBH16138.1 hypothetical protein, conserved [Trypanosoma brucei gambiense DAL972]|eukprot:XP_011778402.1 hypothetical protein, conserved [Trypanosoma brucei gambiense DAL972]
MNSSGLVLELLCNLRWVLSYIVQRLDPIVEKHYGRTIEQAKRMESAVSRSFANAQSLSDLPPEVLTLAQEGVVYLLVAEGVLGYCPPTMHLFLLRGASSCVSEAFSGCFSGNSSASSACSKIHSTASNYQAQFLVVRWLTEEGILTDEELLDAMDEGGEVPLNKQESRFGLHMAMAERLSVECSFSVQAHVILTRSLLLYYCSTLITVEDVELHLNFLDPTCEKELTNMESALLLWLLCLLKNMQRGGTINDQVFRELKGSADSLYKTVQSGTVLALVMSFYKPHLLPPSSIDARASNPSEMLRQQQHFEHWGKTLRVAEELGLSPCLYADEAGQYGSVVLQLHVLRFIGELFAMLATQAEDVEGFCAYAVRSQKLHASADCQRWCSMMGSDRSGGHADGSMNVNGMESSCETFRDAELSQRKGDNEDSAVDHTRSINSSVVYSCFPSAHNRRQYDVMKASLLRSGENDMAAPKYCSSSGKHCEARNVSSVEGHVDLGVEESFASEGLVPSASGAHRSPTAAPSYAGLVDSCHTRTRTSVAKVWWSSDEGDVEVFSHSTSGTGNDVFLNSTIVQAPSLPSSGCANSSVCMQQRGWKPRDSSLHPPAPFNIEESDGSGASPRFGHSDMLSPLSSTACEAEVVVGIDGSRITSENSFRINTVERGYTPQASSSGLSPLTPVETTDRGTIPVDMAIQKNNDAKNGTFPRAPHSGAREQMQNCPPNDESDDDALLREVYSLYPALPTIDSRQKLLETLEHQHVLIKRLTQKLLEAKKASPSPAGLAPPEVADPNRTLPSIMNKAKERFHHESAAGRTGNEKMNSEK